VGASANLSVGASSRGFASECWSVGVLGSGMTMSLSWSPCDFGELAGESEGISVGQFRLHTMLARSTGAYQPHSIPYRWHLNSTL
jgi:hypothetical protein